MLNCSVSHGIDPYMFFFSSEFEVIPKSSQAAKVDYCTSERRYVQRAVRKLECIDKYMHFIPRARVATWASRES